MMKKSTPVKKPGTLKKGPTRTSSFFSGSGGEPRVNISQLGITKEQYDMYKKQFELLDKDRSGTITAAELRAVVRNFGIPNDNAAIMNLIAQVDSDENGEVELTEFIKIMSMTMSSDVDEELRWAFQEFDGDGDGKVTTKEVRAVMQQLGHNLTEEQLLEMVHEADKTGKGYVDFMDFVNILRD